MIQAEAVFDALSLVAGLEEAVEKPTEAEVQALGYLANLLWVYERRDHPTWGYTFVAATAGAPYASELTVALQQLVGKHQLAKDLNTGGFVLTPRGQDLLAESRGRGGLSYRVPALDAAVAAVSTIPPAMLVGAIRSEPVLRNATSVGRRKAVLDEDGKSRLEPIFAKMREATADGLSLSTLAVAWLNYLVRAYANRPASRGAAHG